MRISVSLLPVRLEFLSLAQMPAAGFPKATAFRVSRGGLAALVGMDRQALAEQSARVAALVALALVRLPVASMNRHRIAARYQGFQVSIPLLNLRRLLIGSTLFGRSSPQIRFLESSAEAEFPRSL